MMDMLAKAIEANAEADHLAMVCAGSHDFDRLDQLVCDADNICRDFVRRHGDELRGAINRQQGEIERLREALDEAFAGDLTYLSDMAMVPRQTVVKARLALRDTGHVTPNV